MSKYSKVKNLYDFDPTLFTKKVDITGIAINSNQVTKGNLFIALPGMKSHGSNFLQQAIDNGATAVLTDLKIQCPIPIFFHPRPREIVGLIAAWFFDIPFNHLLAVGITGTNGKTTTADLIKQLWDFSGIESGLIGTLGVKIKQSISTGVRTTPEATELQNIASYMVDTGVKNLVMEVSSHALDQYRIRGAKFKVVGFSNLTQDHLDYHKNMDNYFSTKAKLFTKEYADLGVINIDDAYGKKLYDLIKIPKLAVSKMDHGSDWSYSDIVTTEDGYKVEIKSLKGNKISGITNLRGEFNLDNLLLATAISSITGVSDSEICNSLINLRSVAGRFEPVTVGQNFSAYIDYAHTPDAVTRVLKTARSITKGRVIAVLGCGGDRDFKKRPLMGNALHSGSDLPIFTSDNPRSEPASKILQEMMADLDLNDKGITIENRGEAIEFACQSAEESDCVLILGKGHEVGQEINGVVHPFDDRQVLIKSIQKVMQK
jgi:UDP-N-acetylmuramoyl-L-alanyl-D-glutamate--2,6-diaminopimelate ligase